jgi:hypothetical protein
VDITDPKEALNLPLGTLEVVRQTDHGRVCDAIRFSSADVVDVTAQLLKHKIELANFSAQAELVAFMTNHFGWRGYKEAFAL